jgi:hypothetical protein
MRLNTAPAALLIASCLAQVSSTVSLSNGVQLRISNTPTSLKVDLQPASGNSFYRIFRDENNLAVYAYELQVERSPDGEQFRITAKPAGLDFAARFPDADGGKPTPTLSEPIESPWLTNGGQFTVPIPTEPGLGEKLTDTVGIQVRSPDSTPSETEIQAAQLRFAGLKVYVNGRLVSPRAASPSVLGRFTMFYLPGRGGYFFSTEPVVRRPFAHIGSAEGNRLTFTLDNVSYTCTTDAPILTRSEDGEVWVYHDPNYKSAGNWTKSDPSNGSRDEFFTAASDSLSWWLP